MNGKIVGIKTVLTIKGLKGVVLGRYGLHVVRTGTMDHAFRL